VRNEAFFRALWFDTEAGARASLTTVSYDGPGQAVRFNVTTRHCVHAQLDAALTEIEGLGAADLPPKIRAIQKESLFS
jgi:hypothetical protein